MYLRTLLLLLSHTLCVSLLAQTPLLPSAHGGNPNRTLNVVQPLNSSWLPKLEYAPDKISNRSLQVTPTTRNCLTIEVEESRKTTHVQSTESTEAFEQWMEQTQSTQRRSRSIFRRGSQEVYSLPVVVHVVFSNEIENISDEQIYSQIEVLNQDYRRQNPDQSLTSRDFRNLAVDTGIEFCMATVDPDGNPTNGIDRISLGGSPFDENKINQTVKPTTIWDPSRYFNIWVLNIADGILGFAQFPISSGLSGIPNLPTSNRTDGVVINYLTFGTKGTVSPPFDRGRTATHEIGHWLGLRHVWGDGACGVDDFCDDTPMTGEANFACPT
ncbi:MAG: zinc metalloprotease, partial [Bacteroidota bacterium]